MDVDPRWYESFFGDDWLAIARTRDSDGERAKAEVDFVLERLEMEPGSRILDVACGHGRHSLELARRGFQVTGFDISEPSLEVARRQAVDEGLTITFVQGDMRELPWEGEFDAAINLFTAFGYFPEEPENEQAASAIAGVLRPGGRFLIDTLNPILFGSTRYLERTWEELADGRLLLNDASYDAVTGRQAMTWTIILADGTRRELRFSLRTYTCPELTALLRRAGLEPLSVHGGFDGAEFTRETWRLIVTAERPAG